MWEGVGEEAGGGTPTHRFSSNVNEAKEVKPTLQFLCCNCLIIYWVFCHEVHLCVRLDVRGEEAGVKDVS